MKYYVIKIVQNIEGVYGEIKGSIFDTLDKAMVEYHRTMANYMNASDVLLAEIMVKNSDGGSYVDDVYKKPVEEEI